MGGAWPNVVILKRTAVEISSPRNVATALETNSLRKSILMTFAVDPNTTSSLKSKLGNKFWTPLYWYLWKIKIENIPLT